MPSKQWLSQDMLDRIELIDSKMGQYMSRRYLQFLQNFKQFKKNIVSLLLLLYSRCTLKVCIHALSATHKQILNVWLQEPLSPNGFGGYGNGIDILNVPIKAPSTSAFTTLQKCFICSAEKPTNCSCNHLWVCQACARPCEHRLFGQIDL